ncbi:MAG: O-antigen ligase family protein [bacterium]
MFKKIERFLFFIFIFLIPLQTRVILYQWSNTGFNEWTSAFLYGTDILLVLIFLLWFWRYKSKRFFKNLEIKTEGLIKSPVFWLILFFIISFVSISFADNVGLGFYQISKLMEFIILFFYIRSNLTLKDIEEDDDNISKIKFRKLVHIFLASGLVQACIAILQYAKQHSLGLKYLAESPLNTEIGGVAKIVVGGVKMLRVYGVFPHPNILAAFLLVNILFLYYIWTTKKHTFTKNCLLMIAYFVFLFSLLLTFSRTIIAITLIVSIIYFIFSFVKAKKNKDISLMKRTIFILFVLIILCSVFVNLAKPEIFSRFKISSTEESITLRNFYNETALINIADYPFIGLGLGNFVWNMRSFLSLLADWTHQPVHNIYLLIASEVGLFGLSVFLFFIFSLVRNMIVFVKKQKNDYFIILTLFFIIFSLLSIGLMDHFLWTLQQGQLILWLFLGLVATYYTIDIQK